MVRAYYLHAPFPPMARFEDLVVGKTQDQTGDMQ